MPEGYYAILLLIGIGALIALILPLAVRLRAMSALPEQLAVVLDEKHRSMLVDLHEGLGRQTDRIVAALAESSERVRHVVTHELGQSREAMQALQLALTRHLGESREAMIEKLGSTAQVLNARIEERLDQISGRVSERLDEGFRKTNETFLNVMTRLATIDEAQKKIDSLSGSVVSLQELLGDKRARGAFGEVQLEALVRNALPPGAFEMQATLGNGTRADCVLTLPAPTARLAIDSKFPLENYHRMFDVAASDGERAAAARQFKQDVRRHVDAIGAKYIIPGETADGAVMFVPAEAVFAEIHAHHGDVVEHALSRRVWIVSPTTLMAVLNTARAVLKDVETRRQVHIIKDELGKLAKDFGRFDERMRRLADHIRLANDDAQQVQVSSRKISERFSSIERVELEEPETPQLRVVERRDDKAG
ncbi:MAG: DNA recombination protein RmuC [Betaproteobacteria bacterium]